MRARHAFIAVSWVPLAILLWMHREFTRPGQEGWGAWALAASLGPALIGISLVLATIGVLLWIRERRLGNPTVLLLMATLLAALPCLWIGVRVLWLQLRPGS